MMNFYLLVISMCISGFTSQGQQTISQSWQGTPLERLRSVRGVVREISTNRPIAGALVSLWSSDVRDLNESVFTDSLGRYQVFDVTGAVKTISTSFPGFLVTELKFPNEPQTTLDVFIRPDSLKIGDRINFGPDRDWLMRESERLSRVYSRGPERPVATPGALEALYAAHKATASPIGSQAVYAAAIAETKRRLRRFVAYSDHRLILSRSLLLWWKIEVDALPQLSPSGILDCEYTSSYQATGLVDSISAAIGSASIYPDIIGHILLFLSEPAEIETNHYRMQVLVLSEDPVLVNLIEYHIDFSSKREFPVIRAKEHICVPNEPPPIPPY